MSLQVRIGTFNVGQGQNDYGMMLRGINGIQSFNEKLEKACKEHFIQGPDGKPYTVADLNAKPDRSKHETLKLLDAIEGLKERMMNEVEFAVANRLADSLDVICLQEVMKMNRVFVHALKDRGFTIIQGRQVAEGEKFSTAIAYRTELFERVDNISIATLGQNEPNKRPKIYGQEIAAVVATLKDRITTLSVASLHSWGFQLYPPNEKVPNIDTADDVASKAKADAYVIQAIQLMQRQKTNFSVIVGDMNNNPENYAPTFGQIEASGYTVLRSGAPTNINPTQDDYKEREIDFIFFKHNPPKFHYLKRLCLLVKSIFFKTKDKMAQVYAPTPLKDFSFTYKGTCSDHLPVQFSINLWEQAYDSYIYRLYDFFCQKLGRRTSPAST